MTDVEQFDGTAGEMKRPSRWVSAEDLDGKGDVQVTIAGVYRHKDVEFEAGRTEPTVYALAFVESPKQLVLNTTNRTTLVRKYGPQVADWTGKTITLYCQDGIRLGPKKVKGVRIK